MKKFPKVIVMIIIAVTVFGCLSMTAFADQKQGWYTEDGVERYYSGGNYLTGKQTIGEYEYVFGDDGSLLGMYDEVIGKKGTMDTDAYLKAVKNQPLLGAYSINAGVDKYNNKLLAKGGMRIPTTGTESSTRSITSGIKNVGNLAVIIKKSSAEILPKEKGDDTNLALRVIDSFDSTDNFLNIYLPKDASNPAGAEIVYESEFKLGEDFAPGSAMNLVQIIDRTGSATIFNVLLTLNTNGIVEATNNPGECICQLNSFEYTRISVAIHPSKNTFDIYVNGILVKTGVKYYSGRTKKSSEIQIGEFRAVPFTLSSEYQGSVYVDNVFIYSASAPVCIDTSTPARNGVYKDGSYLRYYKNNLPQIGTYEVSGTFFGRTLNNQPVTFSSTTYRAFVGYNETVKVDGKTIISGVVEDNVFIAPDAVDMSENRIFIGWNVSTDGKSKLLSPGDKIRISGDVTAEAIGIELAMLDGASVKTSGDSAGLRFISKLSKSDCDMIKQLGGTIEPHMLIVPTGYYDNTYGYVTLEALKESGYTDYKDITVNENSWYLTTEKYYYFAGQTDDIREKDYMLEYSGVSYLKITIPGSDPLNVYSSYSKSNNSRSVYYVASKAYEDRSTEKGHDGYTNKVNTSGFASYSPYSSKKLDVIRSMMDNVIRISADDAGAKTEGLFYTAPYSVTSKDSQSGFDITVKPKKSGWSMSEVLGVVLNGTVLEKNEYLKSSDNCTLFVGNGITGLGVSSEDEVAENKWYFMHSAYDSISNTEQYAYFPETAPNGEIAGYKWSYINSGIVLTKNSDSIGYDPETRTRHYTKDTYWDLSDWKSLTFYVYVNPSDVGATAYLQFVSENPETDGSDYYGFHLNFTEEGWNKFILSRSSLPCTRAPLGWNKLTGVSMTNSGWNQNNKTSTVIYMTSFEFSDKEIPSSDIKLGTVPELQNAAVFAVGGYAGVIDGELYAANPDDAGAVAFVEDGVYYVPVNVFAAALDPDAVYYSTGNILKFTDGVEYEFREGKSYKIDGVSVNLKNPAKANGKALFISTDDAMDIFCYSECYTDRNGLIVLSDTENIFDSTKDSAIITGIIGECIYVRPDGEKLYEDLMEYSGGKHPYLLLNQNDFDRLNYYKKLDKTLPEYIRKIEASYGVGSGQYKAVPVDYAIPDGQRLLSVSNTASSRLLAWSLLYKLYENDNPDNAKLIAERIWKELEAISHFQDWHPVHYLDTAVLAYPVAISYDWLYDYWSDAEKNVIESMLYGFALKTTTTLGGSYGLGSSTNNWCGVCNGGAGAAAFALATVDHDIEWKSNSSALPTHDEVPFEKQEIQDGESDTGVLSTVTKYITQAEDVHRDVLMVMETCVKSIENGMGAYAPDGGYVEGPGYWAFGTTYAHILISTLDKACGTDYGVYEAPGFAQSVYFSTYMGSEKTVWGIHDGGSESSDTNIAAWFAQKSQDGNVNAIRRQAINNGWKGISIYDIIYYSPHLINNTITLDLDSYYSLDPVMTFRSSWTPKNNIFTGLHGGSNAASHGDLDIGNFVISVNGVYLISDLGKEEYNTVGYFGVYRWSYYRKRAEGHNTLVMLEHGDTWRGKSGKPAVVSGQEKENTAMTTNPPTPDQITSAVSKCLRYESGKGSALGVVDMSAAYKNMTEGIRGLYFTDDRSTIIIQDEAKFNKSMDIWWQAQTEGKITVSPDGRSATISRGGITLYAEIVCDNTNAKFTAMPAESLDPEYVGDTIHSEHWTSDTEFSREFISKLCINVNDVKELKLAVVFKVINGANEAPESGTIYSWTDIKDWKVD